MRSLLKKLSRSIATVTSKSVNVKVVLISELIITNTLFVRVLTQFHILGELRNVVNSLNDYYSIMLQVVMVPNYSRFNLATCAYFHGALQRNRRRKKAIFSRVPELQTQTQSGVYRISHTDS